MSYQQKLDEARALLDQHNSQITNSNVGVLIAIDKFFQNLTIAGGVDEATLSQCTWEDIEDFGAPKLLARQIANIFRAKDKVEKPAVLKRSTVEAMPVGELISRYDPRNPVNLVTARLNDLLEGWRFIVFNSDNTVNVSVSTKLAQEILDGYPERELYTVDEVPTKTYKIGERPDQSFDENPLYPGRVLRPDGDCDQTNRSWSGVPLEVKQVLYLAVTKTGELKIDSINDAHDVLDLVMGKTDAEALKTVRRRYTKATALLKELQQQGKAPALKIFKKTGDAKKNNPFGTHQTY